MLVHSMLLSLCSAISSVGVLRMTSWRTAVADEKLLFSVELRSTFCNGLMASLVVAPSKCLGHKIPSSWAIVIYDASDLIIYGTIQEGKAATDMPCSLGHAEFSETA